MKHIFQSLKVRPFSKALFGIRNQTSLTSQPWANLKPLARHKTLSTIDELLLFDGETLESGAFDGRGRWMRWFCFVSLALLNDLGGRFLGMVVFFGGSGAFGWFWMALRNSFRMRNVNSEVGCVCGFAFEGKTTNKPHRLPNALENPTGNTNENPRKEQKVDNKTKEKHQEKMKTTPCNTEKKKKNGKTPRKPKKQESHTKLYSRKKTFRGLKLMDAGL